MKTWGILLLIFAIIFGGLWFEWSLWSECRATGHSFWFCERVLSNG